MQVIRTVYFQYRLHEKRSNFFSERKMKIEANYNTYDYKLYMREIFIIRQLDENN